MKPKRKLTILSSSEVEAPDNVRAINVEPQMYLSKSPDGDITHVAVHWYEGILGTGEGSLNIVPMKRVLYEVATAIPKKQAD